MRQYGDENIVGCIVGNKIDLPNREVTTNEASKLAETNGMFYMETSALDGTGVKTAFRLDFGSETCSTLFSNMAKNVSKHDQRSFNLYHVLTRLTVMERIYKIVSARQAARKKIRADDGISSNVVSLGNNSGEENQTFMSKCTNCSN